MGTNENSGVSDTPQRDYGPRVFVPPPLFFVAGWIVAWLLHRRLPFEIDGAGPTPLQAILGALLLGAGLALMGWGILTFRRSETPVVPVQPARLVVVGGPYRFTRNPMYLGITVGYLGLAVLLNRAWPVVVLPLVLLVLSAVVIEREERHLRTRFGPAYDAYCARVRRWI
jgi:protein-S-isoprenylcysteine O-methyltransferase Ste14